MGEQNHNFFDFLEQTAIFDNFNLLTESFEKLNISGSDEIKVEKKRELPSNTYTIQEVETSPIWEDFSPVLNHKAFDNELNISLTGTFEVPQKKLQPTSQTNKEYDYDVNPETIFNGNIQLTPLTDKEDYYDVNSETIFNGNIQPTPLSNKEEYYEVNPKTIFHDNHSSSQQTINILTFINQCKNDDEKQDNLNMTQVIKANNEKKNQKNNIRNCSKNSSNSSTYYSMSEDRINELLKTKDDKKLEHEDYDTLYLCYVHDNPHAKKIIKDRFPYKINKPEELLGCIYIIEKDEKDVGIPNIEGISFHGYPEGHYSSINSQTPISCKLYVC